MVLTPDCVSSQEVDKTPDHSASNQKEVDKTPDHSASNQKEVDKTSDHSASNQKEVDKTPYCVSSDDGVCDVNLSDHDSSVIECYPVGDLESDQENSDTKGLPPIYKCYVKVECLNYEKWIKQSGK